MKKRILLIILTIALVLLVSCENNQSDNNDIVSGDTSNNGNTNTNVGTGNNSENDTTEKDDSSNQNNNKSYISIKTLADTIRQESNEADVNIIFVNSKESLTIDELFSYSSDHLIDIYTLSDSSIDYTKSEMKLNVGYNHFQIKFKNLVDYSETFFDIEVFRDPGVITRSFSKYQLHKEITKSVDENGLPKFDLKIYISNWFESIDINGENLPTQIIECNLKVNYYTDFYIDPENYLPSSGFSHCRMEFFSITHTFNNINETLETTINFPQDFWADFCSQYPYSTLENTKLGLNDRYPDEFFIYSESYILLSIDYSKYQFD